MKIKAIYLIGIALVIALFAAVYYAVSITGFFVSSPVSGQYDNFAKCLTEKNVVMYGTEWCGACKKQKELFGNSFSYVNYVDCGVNQALCSEKGIQYTPTWEINGEKYIGLQQLDRLSSLTGCPLSQ